MRHLPSVFAVVTLAFVATGCGPHLEPGEALSGGDTTNELLFGANAYSMPASNLLDTERRAFFFTGNSFFNDNWVTAPASTTARDGLGPVFIAASCSGCHARDGRGRPPLEAAEPMVSLLLRLGVPGTGADGGPLTEPSYGGALQPGSVLGVPGEGTPTVSYEEVAGAYADGEPYSLRRPTYAFEDLAFGPMSAGVLISPRVAPVVVGLGLLEAIPEETILAMADEGDADGDGVSGRPNWVWDRTAGDLRLGRFGWKADQPSVLQQTAGALLGDIGITSSVFPDADCAPPQLECAAAPDGGTPEIEDDLFDRLVFYSRTLAVPARRGAGERDVLRGRELFDEMGCAACHVRRLETGPAPDLPEVAGQVIWPYTDLLLHDMGPELADGRPVFEAGPAEWRTPPLWGIGLVETVNDHALFLHDGRARGFAEAILWHGGEAEAAREAFRNLAAADRLLVLRFLESL